MCDAEGMPEDDISIRDGLGRVRSDPCREALRRFTRGLRDVATGGVNLVIRVCFSEFD
jgi:hypothetical protein